MRRIFCFALFLLCTILLTAQSGQEAHQFSGQQVVPAQYQYLLFQPSNKINARDGKLPMIIFLHGAGERGTDVQKVKVHGPPKLVEQRPDFPFIVLSPQCLENKRWNPHALAALIDDIVAKYPVDPDRIYLTGLSMGGYGTWDLAQAYPNKFAAIAPICGGNDINAWMSIHIKHLPIWVFHGALDTVVPVGQSAMIVRALEALKADVRFTVYSNAAHDSWTETYDNPKLYEWFLQHSR